MDAYKEATLSDVTLVRGTARRRKALWGIACLLAAFVVLGHAGLPFGNAWATDDEGEETEKEEKGPDGRWRTARDWQKRGRLHVEQRQELEKLKSIGYLGGYYPAPSWSGVTTYDSSLAYRGLNFFTSGHAPSATLMDMEGNVLHEWRYDFLKAWPDEGERAEEEGRDSSEYWRRAYVFENGDVLALYEGLGMVKVDRDSNLLWKRLGGEHHDFHVTDGRIYVLTRTNHVLPRINARKDVLEDFVTVLDAEQGNEIKSFSVLKAFEQSDFSNILKILGTNRAGDIFHTNSIRLLDGRHADRIPVFREGNVLVSLRTYDIIAVIDMDLEQVVWVLFGLWQAQHDPRLLDNGNILVFDNNGNHGKSRVIEIDPLSQDIVWKYEGKPAADFYSKMCGASHRLPNGNTLITESDYGRAFEVTPDGTLVWEYLNPMRSGDDGHLIATLLDVVRLDPKFPIDWLGDR